MAQATAEAEQAAAAATGVNATPLGLFAFALSLFVLSCINAGFFADGANAIVIALALFYGGLAMFLAGILEFRAGNNFTGTVFTSYSTFWISFGFILLPGSGILATLVKEGVFLPALGFYLVGWGIFTVLILICVLKTNVALISTIAFLLLTILALIVGALGGGASFFSIGGYLGIITSLLAWYLAFAGILPYVNPGIKLPVGPVS